MSISPADHMPALGKSGFKSAQAAEENALHALFGVEFCVVERCDEFAWLAPVAYCEKMMSMCEGVRLVRKVMA